MQDQVVRFSFDKLAVRGAYIQISNAAKQAQENGSYPAGVNQLIAEFMAANALIGELSQFEGVMTLQARSEQALGLIMSEYRSEGDLRAIARNFEQVSATDFEHLLGGGILTLTLDPAVGKRYQGIISLVDGSLAASLSHYFFQSEQLKTHIILRGGPQGIVGVMLQAIPDTEHSSLRDNDWEEVNAIAETLDINEASNLDTNDMLYRLFHEYDVRVQPTKSLRYFCSCSRERVGKALETLAEKDLREFLEADGQIEINCDFCNKAYTFIEADINNIFKTAASPKPNDTPTLH